MLSYFTKELHDYINFCLRILSTEYRQQIIDNVFLQQGTDSLKGFQSHSWRWHNHLDVGNILTVEGAIPWKNGVDFWSISIKIKSHNTFFLKKWPNPGLFLVYVRSFSNKHQYNFYNKSIWKNVLKYTAPGFEPTTLATHFATHDEKNFPICINSNLFWNWMGGKP